MGIFEEKCYGVECDNCKEIYEDDYTGYSVYCEKSDATDHAYDEGWQEINGKWYCPKCVEKLFDYDEESDEYIPKKRRIKNEDVSVGGRG